MTIVWQFLLLYAILIVIAELFLRVLATHSPFDEDCRIRATMFGGTAGAATMTVLLEDAHALAIALNLPAFALCAFAASAAWHALERRDARILEAQRVAVARVVRR